LKDGCFISLFISLFISQFISVTYIANGRPYPE
jgi:hypothetical protein